MAMARLLGECPSLYMYFIWLSLFNMSIQKLELNIHVCMCINDSVPIQSPPSLQLSVSLVQVQCTVYM